MTKKIVRKVLEKDIQHTILQYLKARGIYCWIHNNVGIKKPNGQYIPTGLLGISDILGIYDDGRFLSIEVKRPGGKCSEHQNLFIRNINERGGIAFKAESLEDVISKLD